MKILSASQQQELDKRTMENEPISSLDLMERAAAMWTEEFKGCLKKSEKLNKATNIAVFCGPGNNGGDGLVIARKLDESGFKVTCFFVALSKTGSEDFEENRKRLKNTNVDWVVFDEDFEKSNIDSDFSHVIDAIFGTGLSRPAEGLAKNAVDVINELSGQVYSVDVPSGLYCNEPNTENDAIVKADYTFTFHTFKLSFLLPEQGPFVGGLKVLDIGLDHNVSNSMESNIFVLHKDELSTLKQSRSRFSHKGTYGHAGIIAGSADKMGAALLSAEAALRSGTGLTTAYVPKTGSIAFNSRIPSVMLSYTGETICDHIDVTEGVFYGIGPGLGISDETISAFEKFLNDNSNPIVADADALNILSKRKELIERLPDESILTPHPKEFERLCGNSQNSYERMSIQRSFAKENNVYLILKDAYTSIATPDGDIYFNTFGSSGMATGGSGDVLTGLITGLLAQGYKSKDAAILGVTLHGLAGEKCAEEIGVEAMLSQDLTAFISKAYALI